MPKGIEYKTPESAVSSRMIDLYRAASKTLLTHREYQVLQCLGEGYTIPEMKEFLKVSDKTLDSHFRNIRQKFDIENQPVRRLAYIATRIFYGAPSIDPQP